MKPYYQDEAVTIYCGDAREMVADLRAEAIVTDPVWPNSVFPNVADPKKLLADVLAQVNDSVQRVTVHLGCDSDPRFLSAVPGRWPFIRVCDLDYARPTYKGRIVQGGDIAYVFGVPPATGKKLLPGRYISTRSDKLFHRSTWLGKDKHFTRRHDIRSADEAESLPHPCARRLQHVRWLAHWFGGATVLDPFLGSGTTALACKNLGLNFVGVEIEERYCEIAANRLRQEVLQFEATA
jgi:site-specific DNA-methyltransferase (adenine-specific)